MAAGPTVDRIRHIGVLRVAADLSYPPMAFRRDGAPAGFDVELATLLATSLGVRLAVVDTPFATISDGVPADVDAVVGVVPQAVAPGLPSDPYYTWQQAILSPGRGAVGSLDGLRGLHVAVAAGSSRGVAVARDAGAIPELTYLPEQALTSVAQGRARAAVADAPLVLDYAASHPGLRVVVGVGAPVSRVVVVSKDAPDLASFVSAALHELDRDGGLARLRERWHL
jgi:polar amino acid transport system substrate-binding protein